MNRKIQLAALLLLIVMAATTTFCKKDGSGNTKSKTELITTGSWKRTALTSTPAYDWYGDGTFTTNILSVMMPCEIDNRDTYNTNGIFETNEGATKCDPMDPQIWSVPWMFVDNETKVLFDGFDEYILVELTETTLKLRQTFVEGGVTYTHNETHGH